MKYRNCDPSTWQVELVINNRPVRMRAAEAANITVGETDKNRKIRQTGGEFLAIALR